MNYPELSYKLLGILQSMAPTGNEQFTLSEAYNQMQKDGLTNREIAANLAGILHDGLAHGNWPWTMVKTDG